MEGQERPSGRPVLVAIRVPADLPQDAVLLGLRVALRLAAAVAWLERRQPFPVEPRHQVCPRISAAPTGGPRRFRKAMTIGHRQQGFGPRHMASGGAVRAAEMLKLGTFVGGEGMQGLFLALGHEQAPGAA